MRGLSCGTVLFFTANPIALAFVPHRTSLLRMPPSPPLARLDDDELPSVPLEEMENLLRELTQASLAYSFDAEREAKRLELTWMIREMTVECDVDNRDDVVRDVSQCGNTCTTCSGSGKIICRFCKGTGFFMIGNDLIGRNNACPTCRSKGEEVCQLCVGSGSIAKWA
mmetsp:Transcript_29283/g.59902  ORF Transcript_29283/g.59902 Transcript_29283/m.59902 type:complete len:168 (+) Transcript_29283:30-533(+)